MIKAQAQEENQEEPEGSLQKGNRDAEIAPATNSFLCPKHRDVFN